uniref:Uncharacterized protein n=1 Tax=viral metagenome TaxID=1070528 RepID=A0A6M3KST8_9ZZZZ
MTYGGMTYSYQVVDDRIWQFIVRCRKCGRSHEGDHRVKKDRLWKCECGEMYFIDPHFQVYGSEYVNRRHRKNAACFAELFPMETVPA